jgi:hypothetical protein
MVKTDQVKTLCIYPPNKQIGSFPVALLSRVILYNLNFWIEKYGSDPNFNLQAISIVCDNHPMARTLCLELLQMDEEFEIGGFKLRSKRRLSEVMMLNRDPDKQKRKDSDSDTDSNCFK